MFHGNAEISSIYLCTECVLDFYLFVYLDPILFCLSSLHTNWQERVAFNVEFEIVMI